MSAAQLTTASCYRRVMVALAAFVVPTTMSYRQMFSKVWKLEKQPLPYIQNPAWPVKLTNRLSDH